MSQLPAEQHPAPPSEYCEAWDDLCDLMLRGASFLAACGQLGLDPFHTLRESRSNQEFARRLQETEELLTHAVEAALFQAALKGKVPAQLYWLGNRGHRRWSNVRNLTPPNDDFDNMSDEQLLQLADQYGIPREGIDPMQ